MRFVKALVITLALIMGWQDSTIAAPSPSRHHAKHHRRDKLLRQGGWTGAGFAAGRVAGPAGSAAVGAAKYRRDLKAGGHRRKRAVAEIGTPIAIGAVAGPPGVAGYTAVKHRHWIKRHILHVKDRPHKHKHRRTA